MKPDSQTLLDIVKAARLIIQFQEGIDKPVFLTNVDLDLVWMTATEEIPGFLSLIQGLNDRDVQDN